MSRFAGTLLVLAVALGGCADATPGSLGTLASVALPTSTPVPTVRAPTPALTPSILQMGEAYLVVASNANHALDRYNSDASYPDTVAGWHASCQRLFLIVQEFADGLSAIKFTPAIQPLAADLIAKEKAVIKLQAKCTKTNSLKSIHSIGKQIVAAEALKAKAAAKLRIALGLSTKPLY